MSVLSLPHMNMTDKMNKQGEGLVQDEDLSSVSSKELKELMEDLKHSLTEAREQLENVRGQREQMDRDVERCKEERDKLMPSGLRAVDRCASLQELQQEKRRVHQLLQQLREQEATNSRSREQWAWDMEEERGRESRLQEEERKQTQLCEGLRATLDALKAQCDAAQQEGVLQCCVSELGVAAARGRGSRRNRK